VSYDIRVGKFLEELPVAHGLQPELFLQLSELRALLNERLLSHPSMVQRGCELVQRSAEQRTGVARRRRRGAEDW